MDCEKYQQRLSEYIDNRLPEGQESAFEEHLSGCADCQEELERLQQTVEAVADLGKQDAPAGFADGVMAAIRRQESLAPGEPEQSKIISLVPLFSGVAAAFLIMLGIAFALGPGIQKVGGPAEPRRMARAHEEISEAGKPAGPTQPKAE